MDLEDELKKKNRVLSGWINDKQFLFNAVPLEDATAILAEAQKLVNVDQRVSLKLAEYVQMNFDKYWDEMGETGAENYFETATQKELIAYGQFRAFESVQNFLEGNSKFSG